MTHPVQASEARSTREDESEILRVLRRLTDGQSAETVFTFLHAARSEAETLTFGQLDRRARAIASRLAEEALRGERVLSPYPAGIPLVEAFFA